MNWNFLKKKIISFNGLFNSNYVDSKALFVHQFGELPNIICMKGIDLGKAFEFLDTTYKNDIIRILQHNHFESTDKNVYFNMTIFIIQYARMIELNTDYIEVLYLPQAYTWASQLMTDLAAFKTEGPAGTAFGPNPIQVMGFARQEAMN